MARKADAAVATKWLERVSRQAAGRRSVAHFCEREGISTAAFYRWRKRLGRGAPRGTRQRRVEPVAFLPIGVSAASPSQVQIELPGGALVSLPSDASAELVATAIRAATGATDSGDRAGQEVLPC